MVLTTGKVFLTGGGGFLGSYVIRGLVDSGSEVVALDRSGSVRKRLSEAGLAESVAIVAGDLLDPDAYRPDLAGADVVVHMAARTGKGTEQEHYRANVTATELLLAESARAGVHRVLFISSVAAGFPSDARYPYADAKRRAEELIRLSGLAYMIVRPTMILGPGSSALAMLERLASMPVIPIFGDGRTLVQPIFVEDLAQFLVSIVDDGGFVNETCEIGGPDVVSVEELLKLLRLSRTGNQGRALHLPVRLVQVPLRLFEWVGLGKLMPVDSGQFSSFRYDGRAAGDRARERSGAGFRRLSAMLEGAAA